MDIASPYLLLNLVEITRRGRLTAGHQAPVIILSTTRDFTLIVDGQHSAQTSAKRFASGDYFATAETLAIKRSFANSLNDHDCIADGYPFWLHAKIRNCAMPKLMMTFDEVATATQ